MTQSPLYPLSETVEPDCDFKLKAGATSPGSGRPDAKALTAIKSEQHTTRCISVGYVITCLRSLLHFFVIMAALMQNQVIYRALVVGMKFNLSVNHLHEKLGL